MAVSKTMLEVEEKFFLDASEDLAADLLAQGFVLAGTENETDTYFTDIDGEYIRNRTCLRIRSGADDQTASVDYKGKSPELKGAYAKQETNLIIPRQQVAGMVNLWANLGFHLYIDVVKNRTTYTKQEGTITLNVVVDKLQNVGQFVELEALSLPEDNTPQVMLERINRLKQDLAAHKLQPANVPYRDYTAWHYRQTIAPDGVQSIVLDYPNLKAACFEGSNKALSLMACSRLGKVASCSIYTGGADDAAEIGWGTISSLPRAINSASLFVTTSKEQAAAAKEKGYQVAYLQPCGAGLRFENLMQLYLILAYAEQA